MLSALEEIIYISVFDAIKLIRVIGRLEREQAIYASSIVCRSPRANAARQNDMNIL